MSFTYPVIDLIKTGENIKRLRKEKNLSVKDLQEILSLESAQAIYRWQWGETLPTIDNLVALAKVFDCTINDILIITGN